MLFDEYKYFNYQFPEPQYLGAKHTHLAWIKNFIPQWRAYSSWCFAGSQSVAYLFKQMQLQVITNDFLNFNHQIGLALIENSSDTLTLDDISLLFSESPQKSEYTLISDLYTGIFFEESEAFS